jgi:hypothetical protein
MRKCLPYLFIGMLSILFSCKTKTKDTDQEDKGLERGAMLTHYADEIIIPAYANFDNQFGQFLAASDSFTKNPNATNLSNLKAKWTQTYIEWQKVELFDFGPAEKQTIRNFYNIYPADTAGIQANILNSSTNLEVPASYAQQGFPALDYLLNGVGSDSDKQLAYYTDVAQGPKRLAYIKRLCDRMKGLLDLVIADWNGAYRETFISKTGLDIGASTSLMVNGIVLHYERFIRSGKFGIPSGAMLNGVIAPEKVEGFYAKEISRELAQTAHQAYVDFFNGKSIKTGLMGASLKTYLDALDAKDGLSGMLLTQILGTQFTTVSTKINLLQANFYQQIMSDNQAMKDVFTELQAATRMLKVDMTSAMSITITYTDNDGD